MRTYRANVTRDGRWWMIEVPEIDALTQAAYWGEVEEMARDVIACRLSVDISEVAVDINLILDAETRQLLDAADRKARIMETLRTEVNEAKRSAASRLHDLGWSYRLIGKAMHITHQRVEQLIKEK